MQSSLRKFERMDQRGGRLRKASIGARESFRIEKKKEKEKEKKMERYEVKILSSFFLPAGFHF